MTKKNLLTGTIMDLVLCVILYFEQEYALISWVIIGVLLRTYIVFYVPGINEFADNLKNEDFIWYVERGMILEPSYRIFVLFLLLTSIIVEFYVIYKLIA